MKTTVRLIIVQLGLAAGVALERHRRGGDRRRPSARQQIEEDKWHREFDETLRRFYGAFTGRTIRRRQCPRPDGTRVGPETVKVWSGSHAPVTLDEADLPAFVAPRYRERTV